MNRLDFSSIMAVIRYYISPDHGVNQGELLDELFYSLHAESKEPIIFDGASVNRWLKGTERVSPIISRYYLKKRNREKLSNDIEQYILPLMYDSDMAVQALYRLTMLHALHPRGCTLRLCPVPLAVLVAASPAERRKAVEAPDGRDRPGTQCCKEKAGR